MSDWNVQSVATALLAAPFEDGSWDNALRGFNQLTGARAIQILGVSPSAGLTLDVAEGFNREVLAEFERRSGMNTATNPRAIVLG